jgi:membrane-bound lytic murein transglycosylase B
MNGHRTRGFGRSLLIAAAALAVLVPHGASRPIGEFDAWLAALRAEAAGRGISEKTLEAALSGLRPLERVIRLDREQPEFRETAAVYIARRVSDRRVRRGRALLREHSALLSEIGRRYGVPPRFLVALWGIESNYGAEPGSFPVIEALATLAWDDRRPAFYRNELFHALSILDEGTIGADAFRGSWSGAMGQLQFIPSTYLRFAVDGDGDGRRDIWRSLPDIFASAAHYLERSGWKTGYTWGRRVRLPDGLDPSRAGPGTRMPLDEWRSLGVRRADGGTLPVAPIEATLLLPDGPDGTAYLVYANYRTLLRWNRSHLFALSVCHLADRLVGITP